MARKKRVLVGMSGGVDSSVAAALLQKRGYEVIGITMQMLPKDKQDLSACCNLNAVNDAKKVAGKLKIPHYTLNIRDTFQHKVIDHFVNSYLEGYTPNPCVECNRHIKFDELYQKAKELEADFVATGHYVKRTYSAQKKQFLLKKAKDTTKDQSYFLYMIDSHKLDYILFPLGGFLKPEIRRMAEDFGLINAQKPDSQEICFVTGRSYRDFIDEQLQGKQVKSGEIIDTSGKILGFHQGIHTVTIGQRKGLGISSPEPLYVYKIDAIHNRVMVGKKGELNSSDLKIRQTVLVNPSENLVGRKFHMKSRYNMTPFQAIVTAQEGEFVSIHMPVAQEFITPGQSGVLYDKDRVVGGGIIF